ncbi:MAG TPA: glycine oxidase ThiO [Terriglobales bacterium]|nr:glycine oxidase ThiO [Terriglobales bacterium]
MKTWDVIIIGGGIIGLSLSIALRKRGAAVLIVERGEPGREASHAAAGMLADSPLEIPPRLQALAAASAGMYPEFVHQLQDESGLQVDLRDQGKIFFPSDEELSEHPTLLTDNPLLAPLAELEPGLADSPQPAIFLQERSVDPRVLTAAALKAAKHRGVDFASGTAAKAVLEYNGSAAGVATEKTSYEAPAVVNCAGAWAGQISPFAFPARPVKGQMLSVVTKGRDLVRHVIRTPQIYLVPRSDGRILIGATLEEAGYDTRTDVDTIKRMHEAALHLVPDLRQARVHEAWAGLRPGSPDSLPILGPTEMPGYFVATGHFRDGILLAPVTAQVMAQIVAGADPEHDLSPFSPARFTLQS